MWLNRAVVVLVTVAASGVAPVAKSEEAVPPELIVQRFKVTTGGGALALLLPVQVGGKDHLCMVDTGCSLTTFDSSLPLGKPRAIDTPLAINGKSIQVTIHDPPGISVGSLPLNVSVVCAMDMTNIREVMGQPIEGILGMDFLGRQVLRIDFDRSELLFLRAAPNGVGDAVPIEWRPGDFPRVRATIGDADEYLFVIDTGSTGRNSGTLRWLVRISCLLFSLSWLDTVIPIAVE
jgi:hypothetical protein